MIATKAKPTGISSRRKLIFQLLTILLPFLLLLLLEGLLRLTGYGDSFRLFIQNPTEGYEEYMMINPEIGKKYFQKLEYTNPANDIFLMDKPENTFRIFVMGSSTVYGFPYDRNLMFSRILHKQLEDVYPDRKIEVVNTSITAINSYTLLDFTDEILSYRPDAILIYAGHNEFYGAFGIGSNETMSRSRALTKLHLRLMDLRIYQLIRNIISGTAQKIAQRNREQAHGTLMKRIVGNADILLHSEEYQVAMQAYKSNMGEILEKAGKKGIPVFISEVVSNIRGMEPFNSVATDSLKAALEVFNMARQAETDQDFPDALMLYYRAKDLDCIRFRATEEVNRIIDELVHEYNDYKVPILDRFQENSEHRLVGNNLMTEHVHPNINGIFIMADAFLREIISSAIIEGIDESEVRSIDYCKLNWGFTELDRLVAHHRIETLKGFWPFVKEEEKNYDYRKIYRPRSYLDSIAFSVIKYGDIMLADVRLDLAEKYEKQGEIEKAYYEYEALLYTNPYIAVNYRDAAQCLLQLGDLPLALKYFKKSLDYKHSFFALYRIGEIYLLKGDYDNAIHYFRESFSIAPDDNKLNVAAKLYIAYSYAGKREEANALADELKRVDAANYLNVPSKRYVYNNYVPFQTSGEVTEARQLLHENRDEEALEVLEASLKRYDSHIANRMIGEIYLKEGEADKAINYFSNVYDEFRFDPVFLYDFALAFILTEDFEEAKRYIKEIENIDPGFGKLEKLKERVS